MSVGWKGAGGCVIRSQSRQVNFSRTVWITFHWRGMTSSVSVTSSPSFAIRPEPQQTHVGGASITTRSRGRCSGNGFTARAAALERAHGRRRPRRGLLGGELVFAGGRLELLELQLHLLEQPHPPLRPLTVELTPQLQDLELERRDHRFGAGGDRPGRGRLGAGVGKGLAQTLDVFGRVLHDFDCTRCAKDVEVKRKVFADFLLIRPPVDAKSAAGSSSRSPPAGSRAAQA